MKTYNLKIEDIEIKNLYLMDFKPKILTTEFNKYDKYDRYEDIEVILKFKAPYFDKNGKYNYSNGNKIVKELILK